MMPAPFDPQAMSLRIERMANGKVTPFRAIAIISMWRGMLDKGIKPSDFPLTYAIARAALADQDIDLDAELGIEDDAGPMPAECEECGEGYPTEEDARNCARLDRDPRFEPHRR